MKYITFFDEIHLQDLARFGGKNASLGAMIRDLKSQDISVPDGFATNADAYWYHLSTNNLVPKMKSIMSELKDHDDIAQLQDVGGRIRKLIKEAPLPQEISDEIAQAYIQLCGGHDNPSDPVAVRSSATAEDLPTASFAGQQETFLNVKGFDDLFEAVVNCMASLFTDRAIVYRKEHGFDDFDVALSVGIQKMVRAGTGSAGVMFTLDTETGFKDVIAISSSYGLGETVVQGSVNPDEFYVHKDRLSAGYRPIIKKFLGSKQQLMNSEGMLTTPIEQQKQFSLTDDEIVQLARYGLTIEKYYSDIHGRWSPMDIEWAKDGVDGKLYILQARPETVHSRKVDGNSLRTFSLKEKVSQNANLTSGLCVGNSIASGKARVLSSLHELSTFNPGDIIVTDMTDPDWVPLMKRSSAIVTNRGGRTCHAAIVSRELGIPAVIGTENATEVISDGTVVTVDCSQGSTGYVYQGDIPFEVSETKLDEVPSLSADLLVNVGNPDRAFTASFLPVNGVGLARLEFIISSLIQVHPMAIIKPDEISDEQVRMSITDVSSGYESVRSYYVDVLAQSIGMIAGAFYPRPVVVRLSDFKSNEYRDLIGGSYFEPTEENPMLGFRGASRYCDELYRPAFALECEALKKVREVMGFTNVKIMVPFVRTVNEAQQVVKLLAENGLNRGANSLEVFMMVEIPSNVILIDEFSRYFDGFSIGSNDLTQLTLGVDRDSGKLAHLFDERDLAVKKMLSLAIKGAQRNGRYIGICGQAPSDHPQIADFLLESGINSLSLIPDSVIPFLRHRAQKKL